MAHSTEKHAATSNTISQLSRSADTQYDKQKLDEEQARRLAVEYIAGSPEERALVRKLDWRLVVRSWRYYSRCSLLMLV